MTKVAKVFRWLGVVFVLAGGVQAFVPVDDCGSVVQPDAMRSTAACVVPLADQRETVWLLIAVGVALLLAWQVVNWRKRQQS